MRTNISFLNSLGLSEIIQQPVLSDDLTEEFNRRQAWMSAQPALIQRYLEVQGKGLAEALLEDRSRVRFALPDRIVCPVENLERPTPVSIPQNCRTFSAGNFIERLKGMELSGQLHQFLTKLESSHDLGVSYAASLLRYATVVHMVHNMLPAGRSPAGKQEEVSSELPASMVPSAKRFFLPQWVAFDEDGKLLLNSVEEANSCIKSMQRFMEILHIANELAPYISSDEEYIRKRNGMLDQLINQGQALAIHHTCEIIAYIKERTASDSLNRGLSLSLPFFNEQELHIDSTQIEIIPAGRVMFVPAFIVLAMCREAGKVRQDPRFDSSTRSHILDLLERIRQAFEIS